MYFNDWRFLWMAGNGLEWPKKAGNSWNKSAACCSGCSQQVPSNLIWHFWVLFTCSMATSPYAEKVGMLHDSIASVLGRTGPSCGSAWKWALVDWCCYGFCRLESRNQQWNLQDTFQTIQTVWARDLKFWGNVHLPPIVSLESGFGFNEVPAFINKLEWAQNPSKGPN